MNQLTFNQLNPEGYPTQDWLDFISNYKPGPGQMTILEFVRVLESGWWMPDWGYKLGGKYKGIRKLELHTGGWSGNEEVIDTMLKNIHLTHFAMQYVQWRTGGHYYFKIKTNE